MEFSAGNVLSRSFTILMKNFLAFAAIGLIVYIPLFLIGGALFASENPETLITAALVLTLLSMLLSYVVTGAVTYGVVQQLGGKSASIGACLGVGFSRLLPVLGVALVAGIVVAVGFVLLIIPGLILACMLYVAVPSAVVEKPGVFGALGRSSDLTKGFRWHIFAIVLVVTVANWVLGQIVGGVVDVTQAAVVWVIVNILVSLFVYLFQAVTQAVAYHDLRVVKEKVDIEDLVKVFE